MRALLVLGLASEAGYLAMNRLGNLERFVVEFIAISLVVSLFYLAACRIGEGNAPPATAVLVLGGLLFRLTVGGMYPTLTEDPHRYRWEGKLQAAGGNPYLERPEDPRWAHLRDSVWDRVNRKDLPTAYGPLLEWCYRFTYAAVSRLTGDESLQVRLFKVPFQLFDLATAALLARWRPRALLVYFWCPLVVVEFWTNGHTDSALLFFLTGAVWAASARRWGIAYGALWMAALVKFWPLLLFPLFWRHGRRTLTALAWAPAAAAVSWPYWGSGGLGELRGMLAGFLGGWTNNASLFHLLYSLSGRDFEKAKPLVAVVLVAAVAVIAWRRPPLLEGTRAVVVTLLLVSANCFPWYLTSFLPFAPTPALLLWTALAPLSYHVLIDYGALGLWRETPLYLWLEYVPVYAMLLAGLWRRASQPAASNPPSGAG
jgi:hypothetical protein